MSAEAGNCDTEVSENIFYSLITVYKGLSIRYPE